MSEATEFVLSFLFATPIPWMYLLYFLLVERDSRLKDRRERLEDDRRHVLEIERRWSQYEFFGIKEER